MNQIAATLSGSSLFTRCGGFAAVSRIVLDFYARVGESDLLAPYFEQVDLRALVDHQTKFVASLMGGPSSYSDDMLRRVHARLGITQEAFDEMAALLQEALEEFGLGAPDIADVMREIRRCAPLIVTT